MLKEIFKCFILPEATIAAFTKVLKLLKKLANNRIWQMTTEPCGTSFNHNPIKKSILKINGIVVNVVTKAVNLVPIPINSFVLL